MSRARPVITAVALALMVLGPAASASSAASARPSQSALPDASATPSPTASSYDPGPKPESVVELCAFNLKRDPPLYQNPKAPLAIAANEVPLVIAALNGAGTPMYVSILPGPGETARGKSREIQDRMDTPGTFLTIIGTVYDTFSTHFDAQELLVQAFSEQRSRGTAAVITRFAELSGEAARGELSTPDMIAWRPTLLIVGGVFVVGFGYLLLRSRTEKEEASNEPPPPSGSVDLPESS